MCVCEREREREPTWDGVSSSRESVVCELACEVGGWWSWCGEGGMLKTQRLSFRAGGVGGECVASCGTLARGWLALMERASLTTSFSHSP